MCAEAEKRPKKNIDLRACRLPERRRIDEVHVPADQFLEGVVGTLIGVAAEQLGIVHGRHLLYSTRPPRKRTNLSQDLAPSTRSHGEAILLVGGVVNRPSGGR